MKHLFLTAGFLLSLLLIISCKEAPKTRNAAPELAETKDTIVTDSHTSANSLDIEGTYVGILPCADCEGIKIEIRLNKDLTYIQRSRYIGKEGKINENRGSYTWNSEGNTITLTGIKNAPSQYLVGENTLTQLDMTGNKITGKLAEKYILRK
jgi:uncharacterized lipoprotein NlpE involved in copper resistance